MKHQNNIENIYNEIMLLSDTDRNSLFEKMAQAHFNNQKIVGYTTTGKPLTQSQYIEKIENAIAEANRGELITDDELQKEIETW